MWKKILRAIADFFAPKVKEKVTPPATIRTMPAQEVWQGYDASDFFQHGYDEENAYRERCIAECVDGSPEPATMCVVMRSIPNPELSIHMLEYESDKDRGKFLPNNWYRRARNAGVKRWVVNVTQVSGNLAAIADRFKAYPAGSIQFVLSDTVKFQQLCSMMGLDDHGIKSSAPKFR
jgi:hypothetical protein